MVLIDSNILLDVWQNDPQWAPASTYALQSLSAAQELAINPILFAEVSVRFAPHPVVEQALADLAISLLETPNEATFFAGKAFHQYRQQAGTKTGVIPDFFISAHGAVLGCSVLTRDTKRYATYFPKVALTGQSHAAK
jgi:predicted nucleic acid-binding protein